MTQGLFLPYESEEEDSDDDLGKGLDDWDEAMVRWDSGRSGRMPSISVVRDQIAPQMRDFRGDTTESEEEKEEEGPVVGPTQEVSQVRLVIVLVCGAVVLHLLTFGFVKARGLFDF